LPSPLKGEGIYINPLPWRERVGRGGTIYVYTILKPFKIRGGKVGL